MKDTLRLDSNAQLIEEFNPPPEAEAGPERKDAGTSIPSVLNKLQKWADYESFGEPIEPTKFIPMKTPMSLEIISSWSLTEAPLHAHTVGSLLAAQHAMGRTVGLIIDLANHDCLYADDIPSTLEYVHLNLIAKVIPPKEAVDQVETIAREYWSRHPDRYIATHCAYGFNRTGFVLCSFLCQALGLSVEDALDSFAAARPPGVKHVKFINELKSRYGDVRSSSSSPEHITDQNPTLRNPKETNDCMLSSTSPATMPMPPATVHETFTTTEELEDYYDYAAMADTLETNRCSNNSMSRKTSLGLAKALHKDFAHQDVVFNSPDNGDDTLRTLSPFRGSERGMVLPRNASTTSDNPSLGFGLHDALMAVEHVILYRDDSRPELHDLDVDEHRIASQGSLKTEKKRGRGCRVM